MSISRGSPSGMYESIHDHTTQESPSQLGINSIAAVPIDVRDPALRDYGDIVHGGYHPYAASAPLPSALSEPLWAAHRHPHDANLVLDELLRAHEPRQPPRLAQPAGPTDVSPPSMAWPGSPQRPVEGRRHDDRQRRRDSHNAVERRRRDTITERIRELGNAIPTTFEGEQKMSYHAAERNHKSVVLRRGIDYVRHLQVELDNARRTELALKQRLKELEGSHCRIDGTVKKEEEDIFTNFASPTLSSSLSDFDNTNFV